MNKLHNLSYIDKKSIKSFFREIFELKNQYIKFGGNINKQSMAFLSPLALT